MGVARSSFYTEPQGKFRDEEIVAEIRVITDMFEGYGYRRVDAELRHRGFLVNAKKVRRLMREHDLNPRRRQRFVRTTDSDHDGPIHPFVAREFEVHGPDQLWVADLTYVAIAAGFAYVALIMDAWSRRVVGYAISRRIDARLAVAALRQAIALRRPMPGGTIRYSVCEAGSRHWLTNLSPNMTANWVLASVHSRGGRFQS